MSQGAHPRHIHIDISCWARHWGRGHVHFHAAIASWADIHIGCGLEWRPRRRAGGTAGHTVEVKLSKQHDVPFQLDIYYDFMHIMLLLPGKY